MPKTKQDAAMEGQPAEKQETVAASQQENKEQAAVIYLGPAIAGVIVPGAVYRNGIPQQLKKAVEECPALNRLLVQTPKAQQARKDLRDPQSAASICYQNVLEYAKKKGAKA